MAASNAAAGPPSEAAGSSSRLYPTTRPNNSNYTSVPISFEPSSGSSADSATNLNLNNRNLGWTGQRPSILTQQSYNLQPERPGDQSRRSTLPHPPSSSRTNSDPYPLMVVEHPTFMGLAQPAPRMKHQGVYHYVSDLCLGAILCQCLPCMRYKPEDQYKAQNGNDRAGWG